MSYQFFLYLAIFIGGGIFGWLIDTAYRSFDAGRYAPGTLFRFFSLIYAVAAVVLYVLFHISATPFYVDIILGTILCVCLELVGGYLSIHLLHRRLWDYSQNPLNFRGLIDVEHSFYWLILTAFYRFVYHFLP